MSISADLVIIPFSLSSCSSCILSTMKIDFQLELAAPSVAFYFWFKSVFVYCGLCNFLPFLFLFRVYNTQQF